MFAFERVPDDVWRDVFKAVYDNAALNANVTLGYAMPLVRTIGRSWRAIADSTPVLWRDVFVNAMSKEWHTSFEQLDTILRRSGSLPINFTIFIGSSYNDHIDLYFALLMPHLHRIHTLRMQSENNRCIFAMNPILLLPPDSRLSGLPLVKMRTLRLENVLLRSLDILLLLVTHSPCLEVFVLRNPGHFDKTPFTVACMPTIVNLPVLCEIEIQIDLFYALPGLTLETPQLKTLRFHDSDTSTIRGPPVPATQLFFMRTAENVLLSGGARALMLVSTGIIPGLRFLQLQDSKHVVGFLDVLSRPPSAYAQFFPETQQRILAEYRLRPPIMPLPLLEHVEISGGDLDDHCVTFFDGLRDRTLAGCKPLTLDLNGCMSTTSRLERELEERNLGTWTLEPKIPRHTYTYCIDWSI